MSKLVASAISQQYNSKGPSVIGDLSKGKSTIEKLSERHFDKMSKSQQIMVPSIDKEIDLIQKEETENEFLSKIGEEKIEDLILSTEKKADNEAREIDIVFSNSQLENICEGNLNLQENDKFLKENSEKEFSLNEKDFEEMIFSSCQGKEVISQNLKENLLKSDNKTIRKHVISLKKNDKTNNKTVNNRLNQISYNKKFPSNAEKNTHQKSSDLHKSKLNTNFSSNDLEFSSQDLSEIMFKVDNKETNKGTLENYNQTNINFKQQHYENEEIALLKKSVEILTQKFDEKCLEINFLKEKIYNIELDNYRKSLNQDKNLKERYNFADNVIPIKTPQTGITKNEKDNNLFKGFKSREKSENNNNYYSKNEELKKKDINGMKYNKQDVKPSVINKENLGKKITSITNVENESNKIKLNAVNNHKSDYKPNLNNSLNDLKDDDFDKMMKNLRENKSVECPFQLTTAKKYNFNETNDFSKEEFPKFRDTEEKSPQEEFRGSILLEEEKMENLPPAFFCGIKGKKVNQINSKDNTRLNKLLEEMEKDVIVDDLIDEMPKNENNSKKQSFSKHFENDTLNKLGKGAFNQVLAKTIQVTNTQSKYDNLLNDNPEKVNFQNADKYRFLCSCTSLQNNVSCEICYKKRYIDVNNFENFFKTIAKKNKTKIDLKGSDLKQLLNYQYRLSVWKYFSISKLNIELFNIDKVANDVLRKYNTIHNEGKRSFLMKVAEKDALINRNIVLLVVNITTKEAIFKENSKTIKKLYYILELTDGYKSIYSKIFPVNPIFHLIKKQLILEGMKLNIGSCKIEGEINEGSVIYIQLQYNSVSRAENTEKLGPCKNLYQIRSLYSLREDGGDISMIDVIVLKKYNYYYFDMTNKKRFSIEKYERMEDNLKERENENEGQSKFKDKKLLVNFKIIAVDSLHLYEYLNRARKGNKYELKKSIEKGFRKCIIEFGNNLDLYSSITPGTRYKFMRTSTNYMKKESIIMDEKMDSSFVMCAENSSNKKQLSLKAPIKGFQYIEMPLEMNKKDILYSNFIKELNQKYLSKYEGQDLDILEIISQKKIDLDKLINEEYNVIGIVIESILVKDQPYLLVANYLKGLYLIKLHANDFFDESLMNKHKLILITNCILKAVFNPNEKMLFSIFKQSQSFKDYNKLILSLETSNYTSLKNLPINLHKTLTNNLQCNDSFDEEMKKNLIREL